VLIENSPNIQHSKVDHDLTERMGKFMLIDKMVKHFETEYKKSETESNKENAELHSVQ
jgi:hypothetical protein